MEDKIQVVIPMSGTGQRFLKAGYDIPKPLIKVEGKYIIEHVVGMFPANSDFIFIVNSDHIKDKSLDIESVLHNCNKNCRIVEVAPHKLGPVFAIQQASQQIDITMPTVVNYCDFHAIWNKAEFWEFVREKGPDGIVFTYTGFHPHMLRSTNFGYVKKDASGSVNSIREKSSFTADPMQEFASSGTYYFKNGQILMDAVGSLIEREETINGEYYVSLLFKVMIENGLDVRDFNVKFFKQWGTPEDLKDYLYYSDILNNNSRLSYKGNFSGVNVLTMAGKGARFKNDGYEVPKPLIRVNNKPMFLEALDSMPLADKIIIAVTKQLENSVRKNVMDHRKKNVSIVSFERVPAGQAMTLYKILDYIPEEQPFNLIPCDSACIFKDDMFPRIAEETHSDIIVWTVTGLPNAIFAPSMYSWVQLNGRGEFMQVSVKQSLGRPDIEPIVSGFFTFRNKKIAKQCIEQLLEHDAQVNGEFYVDACVNYAAELGYKVRAIELSNLICWGTPNELKSYQYWSECFNDQNLNRIGENR